MTINEYIQMVIGKPWKDRATGPDAFDCWGLVVDSYRKIEGIDRPVVSGYYEGVQTDECFSKEIKNNHWIESEEPVAGLVFVCYGSGGANHVGRMIDSRHCLHSPHGGSGVQVNTLAAMQRLDRSKTYRFFKYAPNSIS